MHITPRLSHAHTPQTCSLGLRFALLAAPLLLAACGVKVASREVSCGEDFAPACDADGRRLSCEGGVVQTEDCAGSCFSGVCCAAAEHASASGLADGACSYSCEAGYTNEGTATEPSCKSTDACTVDVCDGARIRSCDLSTGLLSAASDCPSSACVAGACCPVFKHAVASVTGETCRYVCDTGYTNHRTVAKPQCEPCPAQDNAIGEVIGTECKYTCVEGFRNYGDDTAPLCYHPTICEAGMIRRRNDDGSLGNAERCGDSIDDRAFCFQQNSKRTAVCLETGDSDPFVFSMTWRVSADQDVIFNTLSMGPPFPNYLYKCKDQDPWTQPPVQDSGVTHTCEYSQAGTYTISIRGTIHGLDFGDDCGGGAQLIGIRQWGFTPWRTLAGTFKGCNHLEHLPTDEGPVLTAISTNNHGLSEMFSGATLINQDLKGWDTVGITETTSMFEGATNFNGSIEDWDTGQVTDMRKMFKGATSFNQDLSGWDVHSVTAHNDMFEDCKIEARNMPVFDD